jgi:hypothetical protein
MANLQQVREFDILQHNFAFNLVRFRLQRAGRINIRVGGNTQETATLVDSLPNGKILEKNTTGLIGTVSTSLLFVSFSLPTIPYRPTRHPLSSQLTCCTS